jgi:sugar transferase (PEP-CTERM/EpsH1 system associated)
MKILWIKAGGLVPPDTGGKIRSYNILRELAIGNSVTFFSFHTAHPDDRHSTLSDIFDEVISVSLALPTPKSVAEIWSYGAQIFSSAPYNIAKYCLPVVRQRLHQLLQQREFDVIVCDFLIAAGVVPWDLPVPKVLFTHNVEAQIWRKHFEVASNPLWKVLSWREWRKMEAAERKYLRLADLVLAVSDSDRDTFADFVDAEKIKVIPTGVDIDYFRPTPARQAPFSMVFTGSMDWLPNEDAIFYFAQSILPLIRKQISQAQLEVVGRNPSRKLQALAHTANGITVTGRVDDIRPFMAQSECCIVPLRIGGGTRLKIFEAMGMAKAIVSTPLGAEGLPVHSGKNILLAETPEDFSSAVVSLLRNPARRTQLGAAARKLVEDNYSWKKVTEKFIEALREAQSLYTHPDIQKP